MLRFFCLVMAVAGVAAFAGEEEGKIKIQQGYPVGDYRITIKTVSSMSLVQKSSFRQEEKVIAESNGTGAQDILVRIRATPEGGREATIRIDNSRGTSVFNGKESKYDNNDPGQGDKPQMGLPVGKEGIILFKSNGEVDVSNLEKQVRMDSPELLKAVPNWKNDYCRSLVRSVLSPIDGIATSQPVGKGGRWTVGTPDYEHSCLLKDIQRTPAGTIAVIETSGKSETTDVSKTRLPEKPEDMTLDDYESKERVDCVFRIDVSRNFLVEEIAEKESSQIMTMSLEGITFKQTSKQHNRSEIKVEPIPSAATAASTTGGSTQAGTSKHVTSSPSSSRGEVGGL